MGVIKYKIEKLRNELKMPAPLRVKLSLEEEKTLKSIMKILVTGAAGFIGSNLCRHLLERGDTVVGIDNFDPYYPIVYKKQNIDGFKYNHKFRFIEGDLRNEMILDSIFSEHKFDCVAHLGGMANNRYSTTRVRLFTQTNLEGTINIFEASRKNGRPHIVLASTSSVYGNTSQIPFRENDSAVQPLAPYPASKRAAELYAHSYHNLWNMTITCMRFFNVYGPHGRPDMMPWLWTKKILEEESISLFGEGKLKRDWTFIDDIVSGVISGLDKPLEYEILNLGRGEPIENIKFINILEQLLEKPAHIKHEITPVSEVFATFADISKARRLLGYNPSVSVEEGMKRFVSWYLKNIHVT